MSTDYIKSIMAPYSFKMPPPEEMKVIIEVLELYKRLPCLWDQAHHLYHSKEERDKAFKIILERYKTINPDATKDTMKKKIDNMRNAYRREYKKVLAAKATRNLDHIPVLWYYHHLTFLDENKDENSSNGTISETTENSIKLEEEQENYVTEIIEDSNSYDESQYTEKCDQPHLSPPQKKLKFAFQEPPDTEVTQSWQSRAGNSNYSQQLNKSEIHERVSETFGLTIGLQLQELEPMQRYIAEKLISDVIFYGRLRKLNTQTSINNIKL